VTAIAEKREVVVGEPVDERHALGVLVERQRGRRGFDLRGNGARLALHRLPVVDGGADIVEHALHIDSQCVERGLIVVRSTST
jgi:hypothetical protein